MYREGKSLSQNVNSLDLHQRDLEPLLICLWTQSAPLFLVDCDLSHLCIVHEVLSYGKLLRVLAVAMSKGYD